MGSGASSCEHITHGTDVLRLTAVSAAHFTYNSPPTPYAHSTSPYSFSTCYNIENMNQPNHEFLKYSNEQPVPELLVLLVMQRVSPPSLNLQFSQENAAFPPAVTTI